MSCWQVVGWSRAHGLRVIISFIDNWSPVDSKMAVRHEALSTYDCLAAMSPTYSASWPLLTLDLCLLNRNLAWLPPISSEQAQTI